VGQYFSWTFILRRQAQFLKFSTNDKSQKLARAFQKIIVEFTPADKGLGLLSQPFSLARFQQGAIGELMTTDYGSEPVCIGFATFYRNWARNRYGDKKDTTDEDVRMSDMTAPEHCSGPFRQFFRPIIEGIIEVYDAERREVESVPDQRMRRLQHLFADLVNFLDDKHVQFIPRYCHRAKTCPCSACPAATNQEVGQPPFHSQTHDLEAAKGQGERQIEVHSVGAEE
jgi:hypothetical protein